MHIGNEKPMRKSRQNERSVTVNIKWRTIEDPVRSREVANAILDWMTRSPDAP
jgi:hypothetical protein